MKKKYSCYEFEVKKSIVMIEEKAILTFVYELHGSGCYPYDDGVIESDEWYSTSDQAKKAAIEHIDRLESGNG